MGDQTLNGSFLGLPVGFVRKLGLFFKDGLDGEAHFQIPFAPLGFFLSPSLSARSIASLSNPPRFSHSACSA